MKRFGRSIRNFFLPPSGAPLWLKILPYAVLGFVTLFLVVGGAYAWDYTNSPSFCGESCHTMPPEYNSFQHSPHANISCTECHLGRGYLATQFTRKAGDLKHVTRTLFKDYEFPIMADDMRPARETCEKCHSPNKFSDDSLKELKKTLPDKDNTPISLFLNLKTGGGTQREGLGKGIHWHVENKVMYYPTDKLEQEIPYVKVYNDDGTTDEYIDIESDFDPASLDESQLKEMDCITCHNRITHLVPQPEDAIDTALANGLIDRSVPEIKLKGVEALRAPYETMDAAKSGIAGLVNYYQTYYADYYQENPEKVATAIQVVQDIYTQSVFPEQKSFWDTHPTNIGHQTSPGCFRCHDGKHLNADEEAIPMECNLCHSIPVQAGPQDFVTKIEISRGPEPETHKNPNWIAMHRQVFDETCQNCHTVEDPGGVSNTSFCSNIACHGNVLKYAGFDAPALRAAIEAQLPTPTPTPSPEEAASQPLTYQDRIGPIFATRCTACHGATGALKGLNLSTLETTLKGSENGPVIVPGDPENSKLVQIQSALKTHFGQLTPEELQLVKDWIVAGAK